jgi:hypothetical protein
MADMYVIMGMFYFFFRADISVAVEKFLSSVRTLKESEIRYVTSTCWLGTDRK